MHTLFEPNWFRRDQFMNIHSELVFEPEKMKNTNQSHSSCCCSYCNIGVDKCKSLLSFGLLFVQDMIDHSHMSKTGSFIAFFGFFAFVIRHLDEIIRPENNLLNKHVLFKKCNEWFVVHDESFRKKFGDYYEAQKFLEIINIDIERYLTSWRCVLSPL